MKRTLISKAEYARRRGCSATAVARAVKDGRIKLVDGQIDPEAADRQWAENSRVRAASRPAGALAVGGRVDEEQSYWTSRARRERTEADLADLRLAEQRGQLVREAAVRQALAGRMLRARDRLLSMSSRLAPLLAAETDAVLIASMIDAEVETALGELSKSAGGGA